MGKILNFHGFSMKIIKNRRFWPDFKMMIKLHCFLFTPKIELNWARFLEKACLFPPPIVPLQFDLGAMWKSLENGEGEPKSANIVLSFCQKFPSRRRWSIHFLGLQKGQKVHSFWDPSKVRSFWDPSKMSKSPQFLGPPKSAPKWPFFRMVDSRFLDLRALENISGKNSSCPQIE